MDAHLHRRHGEKAPFTHAQSGWQPSGVQAISPASFDVQKMTETVEKFASRMIETERLFRRELEDKMEQKLAIEIQNRQNAMEEAYRQERLRYTEEIQQLKVCMAHGLNGSFKKKSALHTELQHEKQTLKEQKNAIETFMVY